MAPNPHFLARSLCPLKVRDVGFSLFHPPKLFFFSLSFFYPSAEPPVFSFFFFGTVALRPPPLLLPYSPLAGSTLVAFPFPSLFRLYSDGLGGLVFMSMRWQLAPFLSECSFCSGRPSIRLPPLPPRCSPSDSCRPVCPSRRLRNDKTNMHFPIREIVGGCVLRLLLFAWQPSFFFFSVFGDFLPPPCQTLTFALGLAEQSQSCWPLAA